MNQKTEITRWIATSGNLEIGVYIQPWGRSAVYYKDFATVANSYTHKWVWRDGTIESKGPSLVSDELTTLLDQMVRNHGTLGLFCQKYGVEVAAE